MQTQLRQAVVVAFGRTPYCKARKGSFAQLHPVVCWPEYPSSGRRTSAT